MAAELPYASDDPTCNPAAAAATTRGVSVPEATVAILVFLAVNLALSVRRVLQGDYDPAVGLAFIAFAHLNLALLVCALRSLLLALEGSPAHGRAKLVVWLLVTMLIDAFIWKVGTRPLKMITKPNQGSILNFFAAPTAKNYFKHSLHTAINSFIALLIGGLWETIMYHVCNTAYDKLTEAQINCQRRIYAKVRILTECKLTVLFWVYAAARGFLILWATGKWVAMLALAFMEREQGETILFNLKIPMIPMIVTWLISSILTLPMIVTWLISSIPTLYVTP